MFIGTREHTFPPYGPDGQRIVPRRRQTMTGCQTVHRTRKHNQSVLLPIPSLPPPHRTHSRLDTRTAGAPAAPGAAATPVRPARTGRGARSFPLPSPLFVRLAPLCSPGNFLSIQQLPERLPLPLSSRSPLPRSPGRGRVLPLLLPSLRSFASLLHEEDGGLAIRIRVVPCCLESRVRRPDRRRSGGP
jgi:hypothetical protein